MDAQYKRINGTLEIFHWNVKINWCKTVGRNLFIHIYIYKLWIVGNENCKLSILHNGIIYNEKGGKHYFLWWSIWKWPIRLQIFYFRVFQKNFELEKKCLKYKVKSLNARSWVLQVIFSYCNRELLFALVFYSTYP